MNSARPNVNPEKMTGSVIPGRACSVGNVPHIAVCICTYKRPRLLRKLLYELGRQQTGESFTYSIVVVDNDEARSGETVLADTREHIGVPIVYFVEPQRGIAVARNTALRNAAGDYLALIDDDECPDSDWLLRLLDACEKYGADGALGSVIRTFEQVPPAWIERGNFFVRLTGSTGTLVDWIDSRTSNVLMRTAVVAGDLSPFRPQFRSGEDKDFFRRKIMDGYVFVWSTDAVVHEIIPPARWRRRYLVKRSLLQGACEVLREDSGWASKAKSLAAIPLYGLALPWSLLLGQRQFMTIVEKVSYHAGKLLMTIGINPVGETYVTERPSL